MNGAHLLSVEDIIAHKVKKHHWQIAVYLQTLLYGVVKDQ